MSTQETTTQTQNPKKAKASKKATKETKFAMPRKANKATKPKSAKSGSKAEKVLELMKRKEGDTRRNREGTDWQNHSIRGFVSGHATKKLGLKVESAKSTAGERT